MKIISTIILTLFCSFTWAVHSYSNIDSAECDLIILKNDISLEIHINRIEGGIMYFHVCGNPTNAESKIYVSKIEKVIRARDIKEKKIDKDVNIKAAEKKKTDRTFLAAVFGMPTLSLISDYVYRRANPRQQGILRNFAMASALAIIFISTLLAKRGKRLVGFMSGVIGVVLGAILIPVILWVVDRLTP